MEKFLLKNWVDGKVVPEAISWDEEWELKDCNQSRFPDIIKLYSSEFIFEGCFKII